MPVREYDRQQKSRDEDRDRPREAARVTAKTLARRSLLLYLFLSFVFWAAISTWRVAKWVGHRAAFGLLSNKTGRVALALSAFFVLFMAGITGDGLLAYTGLWTILLMGGAAAYAAPAYTKRRTWEEGTRDVIRGTVPGHSERYPPEVSFSNKRWLPVQDGRWLNHHDFSFKIPPELRGASIFDTEAAIAETLQAERGTTYFLDWSKRKQTRRCYAKAVEDLPERIDLLSLWGKLDTIPGGHKVGPHVVPVGVTVGGLAFWEPREVPHILISGTTGGGKSVAERTILAHALAYPVHWRIIGLDPKRTELSALREFDNVERVSTSMEEMAEALEDALEVMDARYDEMGESGSRGSPLNHIHDLDPSRPLYLVAIDELARLTVQIGGNSDEAKAQDDQAKRIAYCLGRLAAEGRGAAVHVMAATQQPNVTGGVITSNTRANFSGRLACGKMDSTTSRMALADSDAATNTEQGEAKGRAIWQAHADLRRCQTVLTNWSHIFWQMGDYDRAVRAAAEEKSPLPDFCYAEYETMED